MNKSSIINTPRLGASLLVALALATGQNAYAQDVYQQRDLVANVAGTADFTDPNLVNPWGVASSHFGPTWVANQGTGVATIYRGNGNPRSLVVQIPSASESNGGHPTGIVFNGSSEFKISSSGASENGTSTSDNSSDSTSGQAWNGSSSASENSTSNGTSTSDNSSGSTSDQAGNDTSNGTSSRGASASSRFIFATEEGVIAAWAPSIDPTHAIRVINNSASNGTNGTNGTNGANSTNSTGMTSNDNTSSNGTNSNGTTTEAAVYKGLAISANGTGSLLYAADFHNNKVDVFDGSFQPVTQTTGAFTDPNLPEGFAPFGIQAINGSIYVSYAKQDENKQDEVKGEGLGFVSVFTTDGEFIKRFASEGNLNAPWGMTLAPASFGDFSNHILVGNFGDGFINAYDVVTGEFAGQLPDTNGDAIQIEGLWALTFGNGFFNQPLNTLFFSAGPNDEQGGLYGRIDIKRSVPGDQNGTNGDNQNGGNGSQNGMNGNNQNGDNKNHNGTNGNSQNSMNGDNQNGDKGNHNSTNGNNQNGMNGNSQNGDKGNHNGTNGNSQNGRNGDDDHDTNGDRGKTDHGKAPTEDSKKDDKNT